jgi:Transport and Golgi organisation 2
VALQGDCLAPVDWRPRCWHVQIGAADMPQPNFDSVRDALSRGALPTAFLSGSKSPEEFCADLDLQASSWSMPRHNPPYRMMHNFVIVDLHSADSDSMIPAQRYNGFNLLVGDLACSSAVELSNRADSSMHKLCPGLHGISNGKLGAASWPKVGHREGQTADWGSAMCMFLLAGKSLSCANLVQVQAGEAALQQAVQRADLRDEQLPWHDVFASLDSDQRPVDADVPRTGALCSG